jgi:hypothetical protein
MPAADNLIFPDKKHEMLYRADRASLLYMTNSQRNTYLLEVQMLGNRAIPQAVE